MTYLDGNLWRPGALNVFEQVSGIYAFESTDERLRYGVPEILS
jgi:hypothetical protein